MKKASKELVGVLIILVLSCKISFGDVMLTLPFQGDYPVSCEFGGYNNHFGVDYGTPKLTPIVAAADGEASASYHTPGQNGNYGNLITINHGNGWETRYAHIEALGAGLEVGAGSVQVIRGQIIGYSGRSGGPWIIDGIPYHSYHLHFEVRSNEIAINPYDGNSDNIGPNHLWTSNPPSHASMTSWDFSRSTESWTGTNATVEVFGGMIINPDNDPRLIKEGLEIDKADYKNQVKILMSIPTDIVNVVATTKARLYFAEEGEGFNDLRSIESEVVIDNQNDQWKEYTFDLTNCSEWTTGTTASLRVDPIVNGDSGIDTDLIKIAYIKIKPTQTARENGKEDFVWNFNNTLAGWALQNASFSSYSEAGIEFTVSANDPQFLSPKLYEICPARYPSLEIDFSSSIEIEGQADEMAILSLAPVLYYKLEGGNGFDQNYITGLELSSSSDDASFMFDLSGISLGKIEQIRIDPIVNQIAEEDRISISRVEFLEEAENIIGMKKDCGEANQLFVNCFNVGYGSLTGENAYGLPWDNGGTPFVHPWPDNGTGEQIPDFGDTLMIQDFLKHINGDNYEWTWLVLNNKGTLNTTDDEVFAIRDGFTQYIHANTGYTIYGAPESNEFSATDNHGNSIRLQPYEKIVCYLGIDSQEKVHHYIPFNGSYTSVEEGLNNYINTLTGVNPDQQTRKLQESIIVGGNRYICMRFEKDGKQYIARYNINTGVGPEHFEMKKSAVKRGFAMTELDDIDGDGKKEYCLVHSSDGGQSHIISIRYTGSGSGYCKEIKIHNNVFSLMWITSVPDKNKNGFKEICAHGREVGGDEVSYFFDAKSGALIP